MNFRAAYLGQAVFLAALFSGQTGTLPAATLQLLSPFGSSFGQAYGISGSKIVGWFADNVGVGVHGFRFDGTGYTMIDDPLGIQGTYVYGIDGTNVVGGYIDSNGAEHGFLATSIPEPSSIALATIGVAALATRKWGYRS